jgi:hypothetical protein
MQTPRLRPKNLGKKKKSSNKPKLRPAGLGATKEEMDAMDRGFRIQKMEGREREDVKKKAYGGKVKKMAPGGKLMTASGGQCRGMGAATRGGGYKAG